MVFHCHVGFFLCKGGGIFSWYPPKLLRMRPAWCRCLSFHGAMETLSETQASAKKISSHSSQNLKFKRLHQWFWAKKKWCVFFCSPVEVLLNNMGEPFFRLSCKNKSRRRVNPIHDIVAPTSSDGYNCVTFGYFWRRASQIGQLPFRIHRKNERLGLQPYCIHHLWRLLLFMSPKCAMTQFAPSEDYKFDLIYMSFYCSRDGG